MNSHRTGQSQRWWRRLERRAIAAHERDLLAALQQLAAERARCLLEAESIHNPAGILRLLLDQQRLLVAEVLPAQRQTLRAMEAGGPLQLTAGGRYGRLWWIAVSNGPAQTVVAGSRVRLSCHPGGGFGEGATWTPPNTLHLPTTIERQVVARNSSRAAFTISGSSC